MFWEGLALRPQAGKGQCKAGCWVKPCPLDPFTSIVQAIRLTDLCVAQCTSGVLSKHQPSSLGMDPRQGLQQYSLDPEKGKWLRNPVWEVKRAPRTQKP